MSYRSWEVRTLNGRWELGESEGKSESHLQNRNSYPGRKPPIVPSHASNRTCPGLVLVHRPPSHRLTFPSPSTPSRLSLQAMPALSTSRVAKYTSMRIRPPLQAGSATSSASSLHPSAQVPFLRFSVVVQNLRTIYHVAATPNSLSTRQIARRHLHSVLPRANLMRPRNNTSTEQMKCSRLPKVRNVRPFTLSLSRYT